MNRALVAVLWVTLVLPAFGAKTDLRVANHGEPVSLDPAYALAAPDQRIASALFEGLVTYDTKTLAAKPGLADRWTVSADGRSYRFHLRNSHWSDGAAVTASTVRQSWLRVLDPKVNSPWRATLARWIAGGSEFAAGTSSADSVQVKAEDDQTLAVNFVCRLPALSLLADLPWAPVPTHVLARWGTDWTQAGHLVACGPYRLDGWQPGVAVTLVRNPSYWDPKSASLTKVTFLPVDDESGYRLYKAGKVDWVSSVPAGSWDDARGLRGFHSGPLLSTVFLGLNMTHPALADLRVRRALALGLDREALATRVFSGTLAPLYSSFPSFAGYVVPGFSTRGDVKGAQKLLADAGFPGGQGFPELSLLFNLSDSNRKLAEFVADQWQRNLGIQVGLVAKDWGSYQAGLDGQRYDVARAAWRADYNDPLTFLELWTTDSPSNTTGYASAGYDALVARARELPVGSLRTKILRQAETLLTTELPFVPLGTELTGQMIDLTRWTGWTMNSLDVHPWRNFGPAR